MKQIPKNTKIHKIRNARKIENGTRVAINKTAEAAAAEETFKNMCVCVSVSVR